MIRLFLAEDQKMLQTALKTILDMEDDLSVFSTANDGKSALQQIKAKSPDVVILDIEMPELTGLEVASTLREEQFSGKIIILTTFARKDYFEEAVRLEVDGYLLKDNPTDLLIESIRKIHQGLTIYSPELVQSVLNTVRNPLTPRETEILMYISEGLTTQLISEKIYLSHGTVRNYISSILSKTGAHSRIEAVNIARQHQWLH